MVGRRAAGFTLIELLVVLAIMTALLTLVSPRYFDTIGRVEENVLRQNLMTARDAIDKFYADRGRYPDSLEQLVTERYLRSLPFDPVVKRFDAWTLVSPEPPAEGKVFDLRSTAQGRLQDGTELSSM
jgi:general secretion pathway protein G